MNTPKAQSSDGSSSTMTTRAITIRICLALAIAACALLPAGPFSHAQSASSAAKKPAPVPSSAQAGPWTKIPVPPLHAFKPQQPRRIELANGLVIFLQEDHELPFIDGTILLRGGSRDESAAKVGLISMYGEAWRT